MGDADYVDLAGCADLLGLQLRRLKRLVRAGQFPDAAGEDGAPYWREGDVLRWASQQGPPLATRARLSDWPDAVAPSEFLGTIRLPNPYCRDDVVLTWATETGSIAIIWRSDDPIALRLADFARTVDADIIVNVDPDFGLDGPAIRAINRLRPKDQYDVAFRDLARVLGEPVPYWPLALRDPDLIEEWEPGNPTVVAPARPDLKNEPLLRMAAMFDADHPAHRTLLNLARVTQDRGTRSAADDLRVLAEVMARFPKVADRTVVVAAEPLVIGSLDADTDDIDPTTRRIGWLELLNRNDTLSWQCVQEVAAWDGGRYFPFSGLEDVEVDTAQGVEWLQRLETLDQPTAAFAVLGAEVTGDWLRDPITSAPAVRRDDGTIRTVTARLPTESPLGEVVLGRAIWVRTDDGILFLAPRAVSAGLSWGYGGGGPNTLARLIHGLLNDITSDPETLRQEPPEGLRALAAVRWPAGTVLSRDLLEAAAAGRPWDHPNKPN